MVKPSCHSNASSNGITALCKSGKLGEALFLLSSMNEKGTHTKVEDYTSLLNRCMIGKDLDNGKKLHSFIVQHYCRPSLILANALVEMYCKCGSVLDGHSLFDMMKERDAFTWTTIIAGYAILGPPEKALELFWDMVDQKATPDKITFLSIIKACAKIKLLEHAKRVHAHINETEFKNNIVIRSSLVDMYAKCGSIQYALQEFKEMPDRDAVTWNALISGYAQNGHFKQVFDLFIDMTREGFKPDRITVSNVLKACSNLQLLKHGRLLHDEVIRQKLEADIFVGSTLIDMYSKCGCISEASKVFNMMPWRSEVSWNAMISGYAIPGYAEEALKLFWQMDLANITRTVITYVGSFKACAALGILEEAKRVHENLGKSGIKANLILGNALVDMYAKCGSIKHAQKAFNEMPEKDVVSWNSLIAGYALHGPAQEAVELYQRLQKEDIQPDRVTYLSVLKACTSLASIEQGKEVHSHIRQRGLESDLFVASTLVDMYAKCGNIEKAREMFDRMHERNEVAWNSLIAGYVQKGHLDEAFKLFSEMEESKVKPVKVTFLSILKACASLGDIEKGKLAHTLTAMSGVEAENNVGNSLVDMYAKCGDVDNAQNVFDGLTNQNLVSWNALIAGYLQQDQIAIVFELLGEMEQASAEPNEVSFITAMKACASPAHLHYGKRIHSHIIQSGFDSVLFVGNSLIDMYCKCKSAEDARQVFELTPKEDLVTWNSMITGYSSLGMDSDVFKLFRQMGLHGLQPDEVTFLSLLKASAGLGSLEHGKEVHDLIKRNNLQMNAFVVNALIDMYAKCGSCEDAQEIFKSFSQREVVAWNTVISGYLQHGNAEEVLSLFKEMKDERSEPDRITFLNVLKACGNLGYLDQAKQIHACAENGGVEFDLFLCNTLIDMYGKCGDVKAARQIFDGMKERDNISWNALITGYAQHGHVRETFECLQRMQSDGLRLDHVSFVTALSVCNYAGLVDEGCHHFDALYSIHGINHTQEHCACMVDILCRAGRLLEAVEFIEKIPIHPGSAVWMALLGACRPQTNLCLAVQAAVIIMEFHPHNTAPYVLLSNICALLGGWEYGDKATLKVVKGHLDDDVDYGELKFGLEDTSSKRKSVQFELQRLCSKLKLVGYEYGGQSGLRVS